jgi:ubiquitin-protein ligase
VAQLGNGETENTFVSLRLGHSEGDRDHENPDSKVWRIILRLYRINVSLGMLLGEVSSSDRANKRTVKNYTHDFQIYDKKVQAYKRIKLNFELINYYYRITKN